MRSSLHVWRIAVPVLAVSSFLMIYLLSGSAPQSAQVADQTGPRFEKFSKTDAVTLDIRDGSKEFVRVLVKGEDDRRSAATFGRIIADYGSFVLIAKDLKTDMTRSNPESQRIDTSINLPNGKFEPANDPPAGTVRPGSVESGGGKGYYVVQFGGIATDEWLDSLRDAGVEILQYVPNQAFFVYADGETIAKVANHSRVRWVGGYLPEQKLSVVLTEQLSIARNGTAPRSGISPLELTEKGTAVFDVAVFARADIGQIGNVISNSFQGGKVRLIPLPNNFFNVVRVELPIDRVAGVAAIPDVVRIDSYWTSRIEDERAAQIVSGNYTSSTVISPPGYNPLTQFGVDGTNVTVSMVDDGVSIPGNGGFYVTSANTINGPLRGSTAGASGGHGHINASIIAGNTPLGVLDPTGYNYGIGVAPKSNIINIPMLKSGYSGSESDAYNDTVITAGPNAVLASISNNSWGNGTNSNAYDSYAAQFDGFVRDASAATTIDPIMLIFSAGNSGPGALSLTRPKAAKNLIATGNSENLRTELGGSNANNMDDLASTSSRGPAADGRVKPDIVAPGMYITGSGAGTGGSIFGFVTGTSSTVGYSGGTSHAAPQVAGAAAMFTQYWKNANAGANPSPALIKAAILNTGQEMNGVNTGTVVPNGNEGWGRISVKFMLNTGVPMRHINQTVPFSNVGEQSTITGTVANATKPVRVTLVWTDPPATADPALVNNLDLTVTIGGTTYRGNVFSAGSSTTGGAADTINNVENVWLPAGIAAGTPFSIQVSATALNGDGILGNTDTTDQDFALVAYNFSDTSTVRSPFDFDGDGKTDISIFRPGPPTGAEWWYMKSSDGGNAAAQFGASTDKIVPGDFTGDGKTDMAFFRPETGFWFVLRSEDFSFYSFPFGASGDVPAPADYDADGKTDAAVFRPSDSTWYISRSTGGTTIQPFGQSGDVPVTADYDGDGKSDIAIYRPSLGQWWLLRSTAGTIGFTFGNSADKTVPGDYTGDGKADVAFYRPSTGEWFVLRSENQTYFTFPFGTAGDVPAPGDYDGDGKTDATVFRPSNSTWFVNRSSSTVLTQPFGQTGDLSVPNAFVR